MLVLGLMAKFSKQGRRCDRCGKIANNRMGEYVRKDGSQGYVWHDESGEDICDDCYDKERKQCKES
jgi:hypothetical protein